MSRCFPYPPPAYRRNGARGETVIESIKLQKEREKSFTDFNEVKKREKKEKRKVRKENREQTPGIRDKFDQGKKRLLLPEQKEDESENSGLTEEHGQPVCSQSFSYVPDSIETSNKRKRDVLASNGSKHWNIIRIKLPSKKLGEPDVSGRADSSSQQNGVVCIPAQEKSSFVKRTTGTIVEELNPASEKAPSTSDSVIKENNGSLDTGIAYGTSLYEEEIQTYKALIENWVPPALQFEQNDSQDQEWLLGSNNQERLGHKRPTTHDNVPCHGCSSLWPHAHHLPGADVYALPYTVPL